MLNIEIKTTSMSLLFSLNQNRMNQPIHNDELNRVFLKPRFKLKFNESKETILGQFKRSLAQDKGDFVSKIIDHHIVIDVPPEKEHFWSPQLHVEVENEADFTIVKGVMGPKPKIWTFFIFLHFAVAVAFFVFFVIFLQQMEPESGLYAFDDHVFGDAGSMGSPIFYGSAGKKIRL